ncbi:hypothetical protein CYMTET_4348 [Cymbomonas tetramitiformis]|uniref:Uncharacterized protein n=1 Tax=Cymbomonas tetramitiformis TaxID=36881 RepID=A0AAE0EW42_9CHLO|nr:hypothetical protein CYMTET_47277 [Cymbomonas tetramitiformis]KAK3288166.1 hypothetical protein CYMTET_4348 [Cymbomonas tetramitiformis]
MLDAETREKKQNVIEHAWRVYLFYFFDLWQNISIFVTALIYTPKGFIGVASGVHIVVCLVNLGLLQTVDVYGTSELLGTESKEILRLYDVAFMDRKKLIEGLKKHEWINCMSMLHSLTASLDLWTLVSSMTSVYTCVHKDYVYLKGHVLWVLEPCNSEMRDLGFIFASVSVFAGYNLITCFSHINMITHYGKQHAERVVYIVSPIVTFNTGLLIIVGLQHLSMLESHSGHGIYGSTAFIYYSCVCICGIVTASVRPRGGFLGFVCTLVIFVDFILSIVSSAVGFSQLISPKHGNSGHDEKLCRFFGDDEINEDQIGDLLLFCVLRVIQVFVNVIILVCLSVLSSTREVKTALEKAGVKQALKRLPGETRTKTKGDVLNLYAESESLVYDALEIKSKSHNIRSRSRMV